MSILAFFVFSTLFTEIVSIRGFKVIPFWTLKTSDIYLLNIFLIEVLVFWQLISVYLAKIILKIHHHTNNWLKIVFMIYFDNFCFFSTFLGRANLHQSLFFLKKIFFVKFRTWPCTFWAFWSRKQHNFRLHISIFCI